ncbi:glycosyltransferase family 39 protein [Chondromyces crocatus]|uniref:Glycosyltransferase RgtA/B/C/D-like domain-containing protein n=1 Tax=Chondromyces crocatus TaxID=52 RepID=A0A0K1E966_CHOCO|nr:glycosyltransferase family 39 protein [Chondromyces crocatus]AKT37426.1 uncharacterized protein CMC5_015670 [Chondromyces crocatus]
MAEHAPGSTPHERDLAFSAAAFVLALAPRLYAAIAWAREPVWDGHYYDFGARRIARGLGYSDDIIVNGQAIWHPWCHYPVGYSGFLGIIYRIFGDGPHVGPIAGAIVGALLVVIVHRLARLATTPRRARLATVLAALSPGLVLYASVLMTEPLAALGLLLTGWLFARDVTAPPADVSAGRWTARLRDLLRRPSPVRGALLAGIALGLTTLVRPQTLLCAPALVLIALARSPAALSRAAAFTRAGLASALTLAVALLVITPWTVRNCRVMDGCALVSTNGGWNLAIGAFPRATGRFETLRGTDGCPVVTGQVDQDRCWMHAGLHWIKEDPIRWLGLMPTKLAYTFDHESFPVGYLGEANPPAWPEERKAHWRGVLTTTHRALLVVAALGVVARPRWPGRAAPTRAFVGFAAQIAALLLVLGLGLHGALADEHPFWPLAVAIPLLALIPTPGRPRNGGVVGYLAFAVASVALTHAVFFGEDRYHLVVTPALCILAACALRSSEERSPLERTPRAPRTARGLEDAA